MENFLVFFKGVICVFIIWSYASQPVANITHAYGPSEYFFWLYINKWHLLVATTSIHGWLGHSDSNKLAQGTSVGVGALADGQREGLSINLHAGGFMQK